MNKEVEKQKLIKIIEECNNADELELIKYLLTVTYKEIISLNSNGGKTEDEKDEILDRELRSFPDFPNVKAGYVWNIVEEAFKIYTVRDLINVNPRQLVKIKNMGWKRIEQLEEWLSKYDLKFIKK